MYLNLILNLYILKELFQLRAHKNYLADVAVSKSLNKAATLGDSCIKTYELSDLKDVESIINIEDIGQNLHELSWSEDGQLLALSTVGGAVQVFLMKLPLVASVCTHRIAFMTSLKEITIYDHLSKTKVIYFQILIIQNFSNFCFK